MSSVRSRSPAPNKINHLAAFRREMCIGADTKLIHICLEFGCRQGRPVGRQEGQSNALATDERPTIDGKGANELQTGRRRHRGSAVPKRTGAPGSRPPLGASVASPMGDLTESPSSSSFAYTPEERQRPLHDPGDVL